MGRYGNDGEVQYFETKIEHATPKALLIEMTLGGRYWMPRSVVVEQTQTDDEGNIEFGVKAWWWDKKTEVED